MPSSYKDFPALVDKLMSPSHRESRMTGGGGTAPAGAPIAAAGASVAGGVGAVGFVAIVWQPDLVATIFENYFLK